MSDLLQRLEVYAASRVGTGPQLAREAQQEIERLREALERIADPDWGLVYPPEVFAQTKKIARDALARLQQGAGAKESG